MKFTVNTPRPIEIEVSVKDKTHVISFYPTDVTVRRKFYETYEDLKAYKPADITPTTDEIGVSNIELEEARELERYTKFFAERFDSIFGEGTADIIMDGHTAPLELSRFMAETAHFFKEASSQLISEYTATDESGVME